MNSLSALRQSTANTERTALHSPRFIATEPRQLTLIVKKENRITTQVQAVGRVGKRKRQLARNRGDRGQGRGREGERRRQRETQRDTARHKETERGTETGRDRDRDRVRESVCVQEK